MAKHEIVIHENTGATKESAPYLGNYVSKETLRLNQFAEAVAAKCGIPSIQVIAIIGGAFDAWERIERDSLVRINTDLGTICGVITGSFESSDAAFDPERNAFELALRLDEEIRLGLADITPVVSADESVTKVRLDNIVDIDCPRPYNLIHGTRSFRLQGFNLVSSDDCWQAYFEDSNGTTYPFVITSNLSRQLLIGHLDPAPANGCDGKMVVVSRAGDPNGPAQRVFRKVKFLGE